MEIDKRPARALSRILEQRSGGGAPGRDTGLLDLIARHAGRLRADGEPVRHEGLILYELDVFDLLAAERIPFEFEHRFPIELDHWFADPAPGRRPLEAFAAHPAFRDEAEVDAITALAAQEPEKIGRLIPLLSAAGYRAFGRYLDRLAAIDAPEAEPFRNLAAIADTADTADPGRGARRQPEKRARRADVRLRLLTPLSPRRGGADLRLRVDGVSRRPGDRRSAAAGPRVETGGAASL
jgi:hypothetical protein